MNIPFRSVECEKISKMGFPLLNHLIILAHFLLETACVPIGLFGDACQVSYYCTSACFALNLMERHWNLGVRHPVSQPNSLM